MRNLALLTAALTLGFAGTLVLAQPANQPATQPASQPARGRGARGGGGAGGGGADPDANLVLVRPADSPGLGKPMELPKPDADGFISMFNGKDLTGWDALPNFWSVKDGVIDCVETADPGGNIQSDLIWLDSKEHPEKYANFELRVKYRWITHGRNGNSGIQIRGKINNEATKHVAGYQLDTDPGNSYDGGLYDESNGSGQHRSGQGPHMGPRGFKAVYPADGGAVQLTPLAENAETLRGLIKPPGGDFNDAVLIADGPRMTISINGHLFSDTTDEYPTALKSGIIALQQHAGNKMEVQFKDIKIKFLAATK